VVHGHSSHHPRPLEVYRGKLILYGWGDLIDDYEGIAGYEAYRDDLRLLYLVSVDPDTGKLVGSRMVPMQARQTRLRSASSEDSAWLRDVLDRISRGLGSRLVSSRTGRSLSGERERSRRDQRRLPRRPGPGRPGAGLQVR
jgi:poly-gamma-glutamate capsule biosynthesis protein CapA/YwtB (metallophosphatase superfamily)